MSWGTNSARPLAARRRSSSALSSGGMSGADPGSSPHAATRRQDAAIVVRGVGGEVSAAGAALPRACGGVPARPRCNLLQPCRRPPRRCVLGHTSLGEGGNHDPGPGTGDGRDPRTAPADPQSRVDAWLAALRGGPGRPRRRGRRRDVRDRELLARPGRVHLEHHDRRGPRRRHRPAQHTLETAGAVRVRHRGAARRGRRRRHRLDPLRDRRRPRARAAAAGRGGRRGPRP